MRRTLGWLTFAAVVFALALLPQIPANAIARLANQAAATQKSPVVFTGATGSLLAGSAHIAAAGEAIGNIHWQWRPLALLAGSARFDLRWAGLELADRANATLELGPRRLVVRDLAADVNLALLARGSSVLSLLQPRGRLMLVSDSFSVSHSALTLDAAGTLSGTLSDVSVAQSAVKPLGSYRLRAMGEGAQIALTIETANGPLELSATGQAFARERGSLNGTINIATGTDATSRAALLPIMQNFGAPAGDGRSRFAVTLPALLPAR